MTTRRTSLLVLFAVGCGDNTAPPEPPRRDFEDDGGRLATGCGYDLVTVPGAEAPQPSGETIGAAPAPYHVHLGLGADPATSVAFVWRTDPDTDVSLVRIDGRTVAGATFRYVEPGGGDVMRIHEVHVCGLEPGTEYEYQVGADGAWSDTYAFRTAPDIRDDPGAVVRIGVLGDARGSPDVLRDLAEQMAALDVDLILFSGDAVTVGERQLEWDDFFDALGELAARAPFLSAHGNHDHNAVNYYSQLALPGDESSYSIDLGHAHVTVLNDSPAAGEDIAGDIARFLYDDLAATTRTWKLVDHHRPIWSSGATHGSSLDLQAAWGPIYEELGVDLDISGHDHIYERTEPIAGTVYVVSGGAGASLHGVNSTPTWSEVVEMVHHMGVVTVGPTMLRVEMYRRGEPQPLLDDFTLTK